jgi:mitogen-activated protein kinase kinase kinase
LNYVQHVSSEQQPSVVLVDQLTIDFRSGLSLAAKMKENFLEIMHPNVEQGWPGETLPEEYERVLLDSLRFFFKLLNWKLKSGSKAIYLKETEIVENEWKFLSEAVEQIDGGDLLIGEHFWWVLTLCYPDSLSHLRDG